MSGRPTATQVAGWADEVAAVGDRIGRHFARTDPRRRAAGHVRRLPGDAERENGGHPAEDLGDPTPDGVQHLLARADRDADAARDDLTRYVAESLGDPGGVPTVDGTGFVRKGAKSCGVARQSSGTAGRVESCQVGVFPGSATVTGRALVDRASHLPKEWAAAADRREEAGVPAEVAFAAELVPARRMTDRAVAAGVAAGRVTADPVSGSGYHFRTAPENRGPGSVAGVGSDFAVCVEGRRARAETLLAEVPAAGWHRPGCGLGAKGPRAYDRAVLRTNSPEPGAYARWPPIRRSVADPEDVAYFACGGPPGTTPAELVRVAGMRWAVGGCFELAKGDCGPDGSEVRSWAGWHRPATPSLLAPAAAAVIRSRVPAPRRKRGARGWSG